jgi:hypothetical protein
MQPIYPDSSSAKPCALASISLEPACTAHPNWIEEIAEKLSIESALHTCNYSESLLWDLASLAKSTASVTLSTCSALHTLRQCMTHGFYDLSSLSLLSSSLSAIVTLDQLVPTAIRTGMHHYSDASGMFSASVATVAHLRAGYIPNVLLSSSKLLTALTMKDHPITTTIAVTDMASTAYNLYTIYYG